MTSVRLVLGAGENDRIIENANTLLLDYRKDTGCYYLDHQSITPQDKCFPKIWQ